VKLDPGWYAEIRGHKFDLLDWLDTLIEPFDPIVKQAPDGAFLLRSVEFDSLRDSREIRERAIPLIERLNGALALERGSEPVNFAGVSRIDGAGTRHVTLFAEGVVRGRSRASAKGQMIGPDGLPIVQPPTPSGPQRLIETAANSDDVADMLAHFGRADNWYDIYKTIELAERLVGGHHKLPKLLGSSVAAFKNMRRSANFYRHARAQRPAKPTTLIEAKPLLVLAVRKSLELGCQFTKCTRLAAPSSDDAAA
jgi:hypothetical protein